MANDINKLIRSGIYKLVREAKSVRMQLLVRPRTKEALTSIAKEAGISVNELINRILENFIYDSQN
jgi:predicted HicB family RNase H-like nuclease